MDSALVELADKISNHFVEDFMLLT